MDIEELLSRSEDIDVFDLDGADYCKLAKLIRDLAAALRKAQQDWAQDYEWSQRCCKTLSEQRENFRAERDQLRAANANLLKQGNDLVEKCRAENAGLNENLSDILEAAGISDTETHDLVVSEIRRLRSGIDTQARAWTDREGVIARLQEENARLKEKWIDFNERYDRAEEGWGVAVHELEEAEALLEEADDVLELVLECADIYTAKSVLHSVNEFLPRLRARKGGK